jgi:hypothetical protein
MAARLVLISSLALTTALAFVACDRALIADGTGGSVGADGGGTSGGCNSAGIHLDPGQTFRPDACNTCTCEADGLFMCTAIGCGDGAPPPTDGGLVDSDGGPPPPSDGGLPVGCYSSSPPAPAAAAGFTHLVFEDDFTSASTIAPSQNAASGYKWYWSFQVSSQPVPWSVQPLATAAGYGDAGPGNCASPTGGILTVNGPGEPNAALITVPGWTLNNANATLPAKGDGNWAHAYFEAYIQTRIDGNSSPDASSGWPAFWSWSVQALKNFGFGGSDLTTAAYSEIDFFETYGTIFSNKPGNWTATMHQWPANVSSDGHTQHTDGDWHTYGCLWTSTGPGTGQVKFYYDGSQVDNTVNTGTGQTQFSLEGLSLFLALGSGNGWNMNVDWVRVWQ